MSDNTWWLIVLFAGEARQWG